MAWGILFGLCVCVGWLYWHNQYPKVTHLDYHLPDTANNLQGKSLLFLSDLHLKDATTRAFIRRVERLISQEQPDLIFLGGDILHGTVNDETFEKFQAFLNHLVTFAPVYAVLGIMK